LTYAFLMTYKYLMKPKKERFKPTEQREESLDDQTVWEDILGLGAAKYTVRPLNIRLPERQLLSLRALASSTTVSLQVRKILDRSLHHNDAIGGAEVRRLQYRDASLALKRTTLYIEPRDLKLLRLRARGQHKSVSFVIRRVLDMYLFGE
jgi:hypothetical protein